MTGEPGHPSTMDKVKQALHLDKDKDHSTTHTTGAHTTGTHATGTHTGVHTTGTHTGTHTTGTHSGTAEGVHGPHSSRAANAADPRVDSDRDGSRHVGGTTHTTHGTGVGGTHSSGLAGTHTGAHNTTAGPHSSDLANKADPRVDSDNSKLHSTTHGTTGNTFGTTGTHGTGVGTHGTTGNTFGTTGTHGTGVGSHNTTGNTFGNTGTHGGISHSTNAGPHDSNLANKADPRVDSDLSGHGNQHGATHGGFAGSGTHATPGSGTAQNTAGPHNSDLLNKLDPRVDADLDGSKTYGGNKTNY